MLEVVLVGTRGLPGEIIALRGDRATLQVYEYTVGLACGEPVRATGRPLTARARPRAARRRLRRHAAAPRRRSSAADPAPRAARARPAWLFAPPRRERGIVDRRDVLGVVREPQAIDHRVLVPPGVAGRSSGSPTRASTRGRAVARIDGTDVRSRTAGRCAAAPRRRPAARRAAGDRPASPRSAVSVARGSTAAVPGGFGTGKTMLLQQIASGATAT